jgi:hypothetical protein
LKVTGNLSAFTNTCAINSSSLPVLGPQRAARCLILLGLLLSFSLYGQQKQAATDSLKILPDSLQPHSVKKATLLSAALPGAGQWYNKKHWKIPIIYAGMGACVYFAVENDRQYQQFLQAFLDRTDGDSTTVDPYVGIYTDPAQLIELQDTYRQWRDLSIIIGVAVYALNILDAHVDAHLYDFNVNKNLSLRLEPAAWRMPAGGAIGFNLQIGFP